MKRILVAIMIGVLLSVGIIMFNSAVANSAINVVCKSHSMTHQWGFWPATQYVTDHTNWCYGLKPVVGQPNTYTKVITSISHTVTQSVPQVGGLCNTKGTRHWNLTGTLNDTFYIKWEDEGDFLCPTNIPYINITRADKMIIWVNASGKYCGPDYCPCATYNTCSK